MSAICQSCGLSQAKDTDWGTESDKSRSRDYCVKCYLEGRFIEPNVTVEGMSARLNEEMKRLGFPKRTIADETRVIESLKRWKKRGRPKQSQSIVRTVTP